jgi:cytoskeleton protein RodZ
MEDNAQPPVDAGASAQGERNVGELLKAARAAQGLSLEQISTELRIEMQHLAALEADRFERIGVPVFVKGYLRQYGQRLGLDYRDLLARYYKQTSLPEVQIRPSRPIRLHDERQITVWVIAALALLVVITGLAVWWLSGGGFDMRSRAPAVEAKPAGAKPGAAVPAEPARKPEPVASKPAPAASSTRDPASEPAAAGGAPTSSDDEPATVPAAALTVPLALTFEQDSWAEVSDARGTRLYYGLGAAGRRAAMRGEPPFTVVLGNAGGVKILVDGEEFRVPTKGRPGEYARFSVDIARD